MHQESLFSVSKILTWVFARTDVSSMYKKFIISNKQIFMPYQKSTNSNAVTFNVQPEPFISPFGGATKYTAGCLMIPGALIFFAIGIDTGNSILRIISFALAGGVIYFLIKMGKTPKKLEETRIQKTFTVTSDGITIDGKTYKREDIQFVRVRNPMLDQQLNLHVRRGHEGIANAVHIQNNQAATVNYWVVMETNGVPVFLGCGLNELAANAIVSDINTIFGTTVS